jgi:hypothetical protein
MVQAGSPYFLRNPGSRAARIAVFSASSFALRSRSRLRDLSPARLICAARALLSWSCRRRRQGTVCISYLSLQRCRGFEPRYHFLLLLPCFLPKSLAPANGLLRPSGHTSPSVRAKRVSRVSKLGGDRRGTRTGMLDFPLQRSGIALSRKEKREGVGLSSLPVLRLPAAPSSRHSGDVEPSSRDTPGSMCHLPVPVRGQSLNDSHTRSSAFATPVMLPGIGPRRMYTPGRPGYGLIPAVSLAIRGCSGALCTLYP